MQRPVYVHPDYPKLFQKQRGYCCSYYAISTSISLWNLKNKEHPMIYARKGDEEGAKKSLRRWGKEKLGDEFNQGAMSDVLLIKEILKDTPYDCLISHFTDLQEFIFLLKNAIDKKFCIILPVMMGGAPHAITVIGYKKDQTRTSFIFTTWGAEYTNSAQKLFEIHHILKNFYVAKNNGKWETFPLNEKTESELETKGEVITLEGLRNRMAIVYPKNISAQLLKSIKIFELQETTNHNQRKLFNNHKIIPGCSQAMDPRVSVLYQLGLANLSNHSPRCNLSFDNAIECFTKILKINPREALAYYYRGNAHQAKGDLNEAIRDYGQAILLESDPKKKASILNNAGTMYQKKGQLTEAILAYAAMQTSYDRYKNWEGDPHPAIAYTNWGTVFQTKGKLAQTAGKLDQAAKELDQAISCYTEAVKHNPNYANVCYHRGLAYQAKGELTQAAGKHDQAAGKLDQAARKLDQAEKELNQAISDFSEVLNRDSRNKSVHCHRGLTHQIKGEFDEAIFDFSIGLLGQRNAFIYYHRGLAYQAKGMFNEAISDFVEALKISEDPTAQIDNDTSDYTNALEIKPFLETKPNQDLIYKSIEDIFMSAKDGSLDTLTKKEILFIIKKLPQKNQVRLLEKCIDSSTALGKRFWKKEKYFECRLDRGTVKKICDYLKTLCPNAVMGVTTSKNGTKGTLLFKEKSRQPDELDKADCPLGTAHSRGMHDML